MYVRDAWYMAAWDRDIGTERPLAQSILDEPIVLYRTPDGAVVALEDRCAHRLAPLSAGRCEQGNIRCMYHGLVFDRTGACVSIPGQAEIPARVRVRSYPVAERYGAVWVWMGEPERADEELLPPFVGYHDPAWAMEPGRMDYAAPARLIHDNLLDLTHIAFVHYTTFAGGSEQSAQGWIDAETRYATLPRGVRISRWMKDAPTAPVGPSVGSTASTSAVDLWTSYDFLVPGIFLQITARYRRGDYELADDGSPVGQPLFSTFTCQAVTPTKGSEASYFFAFGPWAADAGRKQFFADLGRAAFEEDRRIIEAQFTSIRRTTDPVMMPLAMDKAVLMYAGVVKRLLAQEPNRKSASA